MVKAGTDTIEIREAEGVAAEVVYNNGQSQGSDPGHYRLEVNGVVVWAEIRFAQGSSREEILVTPEDPGLLAIPPEAEVEDGEFVIIQIMEPMF